jgi:hypothetical protein
MLIKPDAPTSILLKLVGAPGLEVQESQADRSFSINRIGR